MSSRVRNYTEAIEKAWGQADARTSKRGDAETPFADSTVTISITTRGAVEVSVLENEQLYERLVKFCRNEGRLLESHKPGTRWSNVGLIIS